MRTQPEQVRKPFEQGVAWCVGSETKQNEKGIHTGGGQRGVLDSSGLRKVPLFGTA